MKDKLIMLCTGLFLSASLQSIAQLTVQKNGLFIQAGATLHVDGLSMKPNSAMALGDNNIKRLVVPVPVKSYQSINRVYKISKSIVFTGMLKMHYLPSELNGNNEDLLQIAFGDHNSVFINPESKSSVNKNNQYLLEDISAQELAVVTATTGGSVLPVRLVEFKAGRSENHIVLTWITAEEADSDHFEIQTSVNGRQWNELGRMEASGSSNVLKSYNYTHQSPLQGENLYRLKIVDLDGSFTFSSIRSLDFKVERTLAFYPNPAVDWIGLDADWSGIKSVKLLTTLGSVLNEWKERQLLSLPDRKIAIGDLASGLYVVQVTYQDGSIVFAKIIKR